MKGKGDRKSRISNIISIYCPLGPDVPFSHKFQFLTAMYQVQHRYKTRFTWPETPEIKEIITDVEIMACHTAKQEAENDARNSFQ